MSYKSLYQSISIPNSNNTDQQYELQIPYPVTRLENPICNVTDQNNGTGDKNGTRTPEIWKKITPKNFRKNIE